jgi:hypothetical protein
VVCVVSSMDAVFIERSGGLHAATAEELEAIANADNPKQRWDLVQSWDKSSTSQIVRVQNGKLYQINTARTKLRPLETGVWNTIVRVPSAHKGAPASTGVSDGAKVVSGMWSHERVTQMVDMYNLIQRNSGNPKPLDSLYTRTLTEYLTTGKTHNKAKLDLLAYFVEHYLVRRNLVATSVGGGINFTDHAQRPQAMLLFEQAWENMQTMVGNVAAAVEQTINVISLKVPSHKVKEMVTQIATVMSTQQDPRPKTWSFLVNPLLNAALRLQKTSEFHVLETIFTKAIVAGWVTNITAAAKRLPKVLPDHTGYYDKGYQTRILEVSGLERALAAILPTHTLIEPELDHINAEKTFQTGGGHKAGSTARASARGGAPATGEIVTYKSGKPINYISVAQWTAAKKRARSELPIDYVMGRFFEETGKVGLILASNLGRPFGASGSKAQRGSKESGFVAHPLAKTQEEAAITTVQYIYNTLHDVRLGPGKVFREQFEAFTLNDTDNFFVPLLRKNAHTGLIATDYADTVLSLSVSQKLEVVLVSAPNAGPDNSKAHYISGKLVPGKPNACIESALARKQCTHAARGTKHGKLDSVYRTIDHRACVDYDYLIKGLVSGMTAALERCIQNGVKVVIIPAMGTGLYAGQWQDILQKEYYHKVVIPALKISKSEQNFNKIFAPDPSSSNAAAARTFLDVFEEFMNV